MSVLHPNITDFYKSGNTHVIVFSGWGPLLEDIIYAWLVENNFLEPHDPDDEDADPKDWKSSALVKVRGNTLAFSDKAIASLFYMRFARS